VSRLDADPVRLWWIVEGDAVVGGIGLRPDDDPLTEGHGHIGYGIRPSFRQRGIATWALGEVLREAGAGGFQRVLIVCERDNVASARVAERHGGTLDQAGGGGEVLRYWVPATS
jgi:predicted acetyltransferase